MRIKKEMSPWRVIHQREKYNIQDNNVVVVEKNTAPLRIIVVIIKIIVYTVLLSLAFVGLISLILPDTRNVLIMQANSVINELLRLVSGG